MPNNERTQKRVRIAGSIEEDTYNTSNTVSDSKIDDSSKEDEIDHIFNNDGSINVEQMLRSFRNEFTASNSGDFSNVSRSNRRN